MSPLRKRLTVLVGLAAGLLAVWAISQIVPGVGARSRLDAALHRAAMVGDLESAKKLIGQGADVNAHHMSDVHHWHQGTTRPLCVAAHYGRWSVADILLDAGAKADNAELARRLAESADQAGAHEIARRLRQAYEPSP